MVQFFFWQISINTRTYNLRIFLDSTKEGVCGTEVPVGSCRGKAQVGSGDEPGGRYGEQSSPEADIFRLQGIL